METRVGNDSPTLPRAGWSPREYVWLMVLAQQHRRPELVERLRSWLRRSECSVPPYPSSWGWPGWPR